MIHYIVRAHFYFTSVTVIIIVVSAGSQDKLGYTTVSITEYILMFIDNYSSLSSCNTSLINII